jgi:L-ribulose-5-phosphate 4-epimerase
MGPINKLKQRVCECNLELPERGLVLYSFGNVSGIDRDQGLVAIKPSGVDYNQLTPDKIVVVDLNNNLVEGDLRPSSDTKTHTVLYRAFPKIGGVVHTHSTFATAWAQAIMPIPCLGTTHADYLYGEVPVTKVMTDEQIQGDYEEETGNQITHAFSGLSYEEIEMVLVACHGPFTWGKTPEKAVHNSVVLEELARMALMTRMANPSIQQIKHTLMNKHYQRKHGKDAYYGQE